ncbi:hypothetical protein PF005_g23400 [Phytophthora fragariae]|uniref:DDE Tnp4 domain-containing protein n=1 Tax=Phytophthora fragariae TaxID=53985 RepID=A0A6A3W7C1_9STRA|nr:hypothetical protein PF009_g2200 [Phytophthora fragariae]KAE8982445.1 hypothetical protein PF011_g21615 [Phytophthora fragariae]KAE9086047.1 hypothetical protein PF010_g20236 [Phytophthora fragariae]KAE9114644.1 hypothetical protein PF006_g19469 [Phytophthora fragariae]KAE9137397.1 hypothetical protein PF007_g1808 [Phytophthora fragariae]
MPATEKSKIASAVSSALFKEALLEELDDDGESGSWSESEDNSKSGDDEWGQSDAEGDEASELADLYTGLTQTRYTEPRGKQNRSTTHRYNLFEQTPKEFRQSVRVDAAKFDYLLSLIVDDPTFYNNSKNRQTDIAIQLAVTLEWCGTFENGNTCGRIARTYGLAVVLDGTYVNFSHKPHIDGHLFFTRKKRYGLNVQIFCDEDQRILHAFTGWPGSCGDALVFSHSQVGKNSERYFSSGEYLIGDSGYAISERLITPYKMPRAARVETAAFNTIVSSARFVNENCIGTLKNRWSSLYGVRTQIKEAKDFKKVNNHILLCVLLHNITLQMTNPMD